MHCTSWESEEGWEKRSGGMTRKGKTNEAARDVSQEEPGEMILEPPWSVN